MENLINNINKFKYDYVIYRYNCEQMQYIISKSNLFIIHMTLFNSQLFNKIIIKKQLIYYYMEILVIFIHLDNVYLN